jgi:hypothetical protein
MNRRSVLTLWAVLLVMLLIGTLVVFKFSSSEKTVIQQRQSDLAASRQELENVSRLSTALKKLDQLTIDENTATRLEILRHLQMENNDYNIIIGSRSPHVVGSVSLTQRQITIIADLSYADAMALADRVYNQGRMNVTGVTLSNAPDASGAEVEVKIDGMLYGLDKHEPQS